jgi:hypothetical protein
MLQYAAHKAAAAGVSGVSGLTTVQGDMTDYTIKVGTAVVLKESVIGCYTRNIARLGSQQEAMAENLGLGDSTTGSQKGLKNRVSIVGVLKVLEQSGGRHRLKGHRHATAATAHRGERAAPTPEQQQQQQPLPDKQPTCELQLFSPWSGLVVAAGSLQWQLPVSGSPGSHERLT